MQYTFRPMPSPPAGGNPVPSLYVERFWLPVLGPTALWALRLVWREMQPEACWGVSDDELAGQLGLGQRRSQLDRTLARLVQFRTLRPHSANGALHTQYLVRTRLPFLTEGMEARLPAGLRAEHERMRYQLLDARRLAEVGAR